MASDAKTLGETEIFSDGYPLSPEVIKDAFFAIKEKFETVTVDLADLNQYLHLGAKYYLHVDHGIDIVPAKARGRLFSQVEKGSCADKASFCQQEVTQLGITKKHLKSKLTQLPEKN